MAVTPGYLSFVVEQLQGVVSIETKRMFGGVGIYGNGFFFALVAEDRTYFKVDDSNRPDFERAGMGPFRPYGDERAMQYYELPINVLEDTDELKDWVMKAVTVSMAASSRKRKRK